MLEEFRNRVLQGHVLDILKQIPDESCDLIVTSPPYHGLRVYKTPPQVWGGAQDCQHEWNGLLLCKKCSAWRGELGLEPNFELYIEHLVQVFSECHRVLKKTGSMYVVLGDTYSASSTHTTSKDATMYDGLSGTYGLDSGRVIRSQPGRFKDNLPQKCLTMIPYRFAIRMCDRGWILRNILIWAKPNSMPSSVEDRYTIDFEPVFFFVKSGRYFFEQQFEPYQNTTEIRKRYKRADTKGDSVNIDCRIISLGRNKRCVWTIPTRGFSGTDFTDTDHFAVFPEALIEPMILASCPQYVCKKCNVARKKMYKVVGKMAVPAIGGVKHASGDENPNLVYSGNSEQLIKQYTGLSDCGCNAGWMPGIVFDPFLGSGTTGVVAKKLGRDFVGIELNPDYVKMAERRIGYTNPVLALET